MGGATMRKIASVQPRFGQGLSPPIRPLRGHLPPQGGKDLACPTRRTCELRATNPLPRNGLQISRPLEPAQGPKPLMMLFVPSRGRAQGLAILLRRGCVERDRTGGCRRSSFRTASPRTVKGSGAESRIVQGTGTQGARPPAGGAVAARGEHPRWFVETRAVQLPENHARGASVFRRNGILYLLPGGSPDAPPALPTPVAARRESVESRHLRTLR